MPAQVGRFNVADQTQEKLHELVQNFGFSRVPASLTSKVGSYNAFASDVADPTAGLNNGLGNGLNSAIYNAYGVYNAYSAYSAGAGTDPNSVLAGGYWPGAVAGVGAQAGLDLNAAGLGNPVGALNTGKCDRQGRCLSAEPGSKQMHASGLAGFSSSSFLGPAWPSHFWPLVTTEIGPGIIICAKSAVVPCEDAALLSVYASSAGTRRGPQNPANWCRSSSGGRSHAATTLLLLFTFHTGNLGPVIPGSAFNTLGVASNAAAGNWGTLGAATATGPAAAGGAAPSAGAGAAAAAGQAGGSWGSLGAAAPAASGAGAGGAAAGGGLGGFGGALGGGLSAFGAGGGLGSFGGGLAGGLGSAGAAAQC